jgi:hypothetical protein
MSVEVLILALIPLSPRPHNPWYDKTVVWLALFATIVFLIAAARIAWILLRILRPPGRGFPVPTKDPEQ